MSEYKVGHAWTTQDTARAIQHLAQRRDITVWQALGMWERDGSVSAVESQGVTAILEQDEREEEA